MAAVAILRSSACCELFFFGKRVSTYGSAPDNSYHQTKTSISFWCRQGLNLISLIQLSETLLVELTNKNIIKYC